MKKLILLFLLSLPLLAQNPPVTANRIIRGYGVPTTGCATLADVAKVYVQLDSMSTSSPLYTCTNTGTNTYAWEGTGSGGGGGATITGSIGQVPVISGVSAATGNAAFVANFTALPVPAAPSLTKVGAGTGTTWGYRLACGMIGGSPLALYSAAGAEATIDGNATLDGTHSITVHIPTLTAPATSCDVYRTTAGGTPSTTGLIGNAASGLTVSDIGLDVSVANSIFFNVVPDMDGSVGVAAAGPYVNINSGSCFGSLCFANNDVQFQNNRAQSASTGLAILEHSLSPTYDGLSFISYTIADGSGAVSGFESDVDLRVNVNSAAVTSNLIARHTSATGYLWGNQSSVNSEGATTTYAFDIPVFSYSSTLQLGTITNSSGLSGAVGFLGHFIEIAGDVPWYAGVWLNSPSSGGGTLETAYQYYSADLVSSPALNNYYAWDDPDGIYRRKHDCSFNAVCQSISALYNPQFPKYAPGAPRYERLIQGEFNGNVSEIGNYAGGTGTVRNLKLMGQEVHIGQASNIADTTFTGAGLNDGYYNGTFTSTTATYCAIIDGTGMPDTFKWGTNGGCDNGATTVAITGANQTLSNGVVIKFAATTGHTATNKWSVVATGATDNANFDSTGILRTAGYKSSDGSAGISCSVVTAAATITIKNGIVTALTGC